MNCTAHFFALILPHKVQCYVMFILWCKFYCIFLSQQFPILKPDDNKTTQEIRCGNNLISSFVIPDILLLATYIYGVYCYRTLDVQDNLENLADMVSV